MNNQRNAYSFEPHPGHTPTGVSRTKQSFGDECDINKILAQYENNGILPQDNPLTPQYGEAPTQDFRDMMEIVVQSRESFEALPTDLRQRFGNSPELFLSFVENPANRPEMLSLGLLEKTGETSPEAEKAPYGRERAPQGPETPPAESTADPNPTAE